MLATFSSVHTFFVMGGVSMQVISATQERRHFRRIIKLQQEGHSFVITKKASRPASLCRLKPRDACAVGHVIAIRSWAAENHDPLDAGQPDASPTPIMSAPQLRSALKEC